jgi:PPK2 family polyphosphate:nucleotide phosphotransferase
MSYSKQFIVAPGSKVKLDKIDASYTGEHQTREQALPETEQHCGRLRDLQYLMYAEDKRSLLVCLQAMDAGGKDGTIRHVIGAMNAQGCSVHAFKQPSAEEAAHDFLWRVHAACPRRGRVAVFNRSHYEDVLIVRVHHLVPEEMWSRRYDAINAFERQLAENGTHILKFYLHISKDEQLARFRQRLDDPARHWKISEADYAERALWDDYVEAYQDALSRCSTVYAPWFVIPANRKWFRNLAVSQIIADTLAGLGMRFPEPTIDIAEIRKKYHAAEKAA